MVKRQEICDFLDDVFSWLAPRDVSNNGMQVQGNEDVGKIAFAVDACQRVFELAAKRGADMLIVHHGISWGGGLKRITDYHQRRLKTLLDANISLLAYHLPLDAHEEIGNNAVLADMLALSKRKRFFVYDDTQIGYYGELPAPASLAEVAQTLKQQLKCECKLLPGKNGDMVKTLGIVSGAGPDALEECAQLGLDALLTGEIGHQHLHPAWEMGVSIIAAGHYATETTGIKALQKKLRKQFKVKCEFIDWPTGF